MSILTSTHVGKTKYTVFFQDFDYFIEKILWNIAYNGQDGYYKHLYNFDIKNIRTGYVSKIVFTFDCNLTEGLTDVLSKYLYKVNKNDKNHLVTELENEIKNNIISTLKNYFQTHNAFPCECIVKDAVRLWLSEKDEKYERAIQSNYLLLI